MPKEGGDREECSVLEDRAVTVETSVGNPALRFANSRTSAILVPNGVVQRREFRMLVVDCHAGCK